MNVAFPLRDGYFGALQATPEDRARWTDRMREHVEQTLQEERPFFASKYEDIDTRKWKLVRRKDQLRVFRPRRDHASSRLPSLLQIGTIEGMLEDVIYGVHNSTTRDMRTTTSFLSSDALDVAVLAVFENGSDDDTYRSFALKWRVLETPAGSLVKNRDVVALEYMGIARDDRDERYAFHICDSFDHPVCPPFHPQCVVRATAHTRILYRQLPSGRVGVYYRTEYTSGGRIPTLLARWTAAEVAVSIGSSVECAEAKKLTAMALANHASNTQIRQHERNCVICNETKATGSCDVCSSTICGRCRSPKFLLSDRSKIPITCCKQCIVVAKNMTVDARQPLATISAASWRGRRAIVSANVQTTLPEAVDQETPKTLEIHDIKLVDCHRAMNNCSKTCDDMDEVGSTRSAATESTVESLASNRSDALDVSSRVRALMVTPTDSPIQTPDTATSLYLQIEQLLLTAEHTYHLTKANANHWV